MAKWAAARPSPAQLGCPDVLAHLDVTSHDSTPAAVGAEGQWGIATGATLQLYSDRNA